MNSCIFFKYCIRIFLQLFLQYLPFLLPLQYMLLVFSTQNVPPGWTSVDFLLTPSPSSCPRSCWMPPKDWIFIVDILWFSRICLAYNFEFQYKPSATGMDFCNSQHISRGVVNGKAGKAAAIPKFSDTLTLSQSEGADYSQQLALPHLIIFCNYAPAFQLC